MAHRVAWDAISDFLFTLLALRYHEGRKEEGNGKKKPLEVFAMATNEVIRALEEQAAELRPVIVKIVFKSKDEFQELERRLTTTYIDPKTGTKWDKERVQKILTLAAWNLFVKEVRVREEKRGAEVRRLKQKLESEKDESKRRRLEEEIAGLKEQAVENVLGSKQLEKEIRTWLDAFEAMDDERFYQAVDLMEEEKRKLLHSLQEGIRDLKEKKWPTFLAKLTELDEAVASWADEAKRRSQERREERNSRRWIDTRRWRLFR